MAIFSILIVLLIVVHLSMWFILCVGAVALFMFIVMMLIFTLFKMFLSLFSLGILAVIAGWFALPAAFWCVCQLL